MSFLFWRSRELRLLAPDLKGKQRAVDKEPECRCGHKRSLGNAGTSDSIQSEPGRHQISLVEIHLGAADWSLWRLSLHTDTTECVTESPLSLSPLPPFFPSPQLFLSRGGSHRPACRPHARHCFSFSAVKVMNHICASPSITPSLLSLSLFFFPPHPPQVTVSQSPFSLPPCFLPPFLFLNSLVLFNTFQPTTTSSTGWLQWGCRHISASRPRSGVTYYGADPLPDPGSAQGLQCRLDLKAPGLILQNKKKN